MGYDKKLFQIVSALVGQQNTISVPRPFIKFFDGNYVRGAILAELVFWSGESTRKDGYIYKRNADLCEKFIQTDDQIRYALEKIQEKLGDAMDVKLKKAATKNGVAVPTLHYKFDAKKVLELIFPEHQDTENPIRENSRNHGSGKIPESYTDNNTDNTIQITKDLLSLPTKKTEPAEPKKPKRGSQIPDDFKNEHHFDLANRVGITLEPDEFEQFKDYHKAKGTVFKCWNSALNTWIRNAAKFKKARKDPPKKYNINGFSGDYSQNIDGANF